MTLTFTEHLRNEIPVMFTPFSEVAKLYIRKEYDPVPISPTGYSSIFNVYAGEAGEATEATLFHQYSIYTTKIDYPASKPS